MRDKQQIILTDHHLFETIMNEGFSKIVVKAVPNSVRRVEHIS
jgi:nucleoside 2-deoxyribosyltransferase